MTRLIKSIILAGLLPCAVMAQDEIPASLRDFSGGLNDNRTSILLQANESPDTLNTVVDDPWGAVKTRNGYLSCGSIPSGNVVTGAYEYVKSNGNHELILTDNISVYTTLDCVTITTITTGLSSSQPVYFDTFRDKLWIVNGSTWTRHWDGSTLTQSTEAPRGQYITHWKERVWMARVPSGLSSVVFSNLVDDSGVTVDPSVSTQVWTTLNTFYVGQDDGSPIYGIKVYKDNLYVFKEQAIYRIIFESELDSALTKTVAQVGCKFQDSIVELDNLLYFVGPDGIYKFDGNDAVRISDNINNLFKRLKQPSRLDKFKIWTDAADYDKGTFDGVSSTTVSGSLVLSGTTTLPTFDNFTDNNITSNPTWTQGSCSQGPTVPGYINYAHVPTQYCTLYTSLNPILSVSTYSLSLYMSGRAAASANSLPNFTWDIFNSQTDRLGNGYRVYIFVADYTTPANAWIMNFQRVDGGVPTTIGSAYYCSGGAGPTISMNDTLKVIRTAAGDWTVTYPPCGTITGTDATYSPTSGYTAFYNTTDGSGTGTATNTRMDDIQISSGGYIGTGNSTGSWTSEISTFTGLSRYRNLEVGETLNGQSIVYQIRTATSTYNIGLQSYVTVTPGSIISTKTADTHFQVKAMLTTADISKTPQIDDITANYQTGDTTISRLSAIKYDNRYLLSGSTGTSTDYNDTVIAKTKMPLDNFVPWNLPVSYFTLWNNNLYGGVSNTANVARFDYGTNDNGSAINAYWQWGDQHFGALAYKKNLAELYLYYVPTQSSASSYINYGVANSSYTTSRTINMTGTNRFGLSQTLRNFGIGNAFTVKIGNAALDQTFKVLGIDLWATKYKFRE